MLQSLSSKQRHDIQEILAHRESVLYGAVRAGKSYATLDALPLLVQLHYNELCICGTKSLSTFKRNILTPLKKLYPGFVSDNLKQGTFTFFGKEIWVISYTNKDSCDRIQGSSIGLAIMDEGTLMNAAFFDMLLTRLDTTTYHLVITCNPSSQLHFLYKYLKSDPNIYSSRYGINDNPYLPQEVKHQLLTRFNNNPTFKKRYIDGEWASSDGLYISAFDATLHLRKLSEVPDLEDFLQPGTSLVLGTDPASSHDKTAVVPIVISKDRKRVLILKRFIHDPQKSMMLSNIQQVEKLKTFLNTILTDPLLPLGRVPGLNKYMVVDCAANDFYVQATYAFPTFTVIRIGDKSIKETADKVNNLLSTNSMIVVDEGTNGDYDFTLGEYTYKDELVDELGNVHITERFSPNSGRMLPALIDQEPNDAIDGLRYGIYAAFSVSNLNDKQEFQDWGARGLSRLPWMTPGTHNW